MLKSAFNAVTRIHSRPAMLKRLGTPDIFSPVRVTPANYFRFLRGPEYTTVAGKEFIIPVDAILGQFAQKISFSAVPVAGDYKIQFGAEKTTALVFNANAAAVQVAVRLLTGLSNVTVTGDYTAGFTFTFVGSSTQPAALSVTESTIVVTTTVANTYSPWGPLRKADRIILDGVSVLAIDEIIDMANLGGVAMGYRCRCD